MQLLGHPPTAILNLWGECNLSVTFVKVLMNDCSQSAVSHRPLLQVVPLQTTIGRTLEPMPPVLRFHKLNHFRNLVKGNPLNFQRLTHGQSNVSISEPPRGFCHNSHLMISLLPFYSSNSPKLAIIPSHIISAISC